MEVMNLEGDFSTRTSRNGRARLDSFFESKAKRRVKQVDAVQEKIAFIFIAEYYEGVIHIAIIHLLFGSGLQYVYESKLLQTTFKPRMYCCYMDDTFIVFSNEDECDPFLDSIYSLHLSLRFTFEKESNLAIPFRDVFVERSPSKFISSIYRKPTFIGQISTVRGSAKLT